MGGGIHMAKYWDIGQYAAKARQAAADGIVLLRNENDVLPLRDGARIAVFGRSQFHYYKSGTGSGGSVNTSYAVGVYEALRDSNRYTLDVVLREIYEKWVIEHPFQAGQGWADEPWFQEEMPVDEAMVQEASLRNEIALVLIGRTAGEDQDNKAEAGSFLLTEKELDLLRKVCSCFSRTVVLLNTGNIIDMSWVEETNPAAIAYIWQGGQEGGNGVLDVLSGDVSPSGRLADTIALSIDDYPSTANFGSLTENIQYEDIYVGYRYFETFARDKVLYPFGYGLSYTHFESKTLHFDLTANCISLVLLITNTGKYAGKTSVPVYCSAPQGKLGKPARVLIGFRKTGLLRPGEQEELHFEIPLSAFASYDDSGVTGARSAFVCEPGIYRIFAGGDVRRSLEAGTFKLDELFIACQCEEALAPVKAFDRLRPATECGSLAKAVEPAPLQTITPQSKREHRLPSCLPYAGNLGHHLFMTVSGGCDMDTFLSQLSDEDLCAMMRGEGSGSSLVTPGIAGSFGGVTESLRSFGIPLAGCADGPSGIRMDSGATAFSLPNGTCLACSFDEKLNEELFSWEGLELRRNRIDALLGPGMNIHRNPLNGRNFEYFSEDPLLTGKIASAQLHGLHTWGVTGVIKHFCGNTQETKRHSVNHVVSERALREIYLKGFEIAVKEGRAKAVMSTYGPVNGLWTSGNYDLLTVILRDEWGFDGIVMTDWWAQANDAVGEPGLYENVAAQVRAQNDLNMINVNAGENSNHDNLMEALKAGKLTRAELVRSAKNICRFLIGSPCMARTLGVESELDKELQESLKSESASWQNLIHLEMSEDELEIDPSLIETGRGATTVFLVHVPRRLDFVLELKIRALGDNRAAQLPISVFKDIALIQTVTLNGTNTDWQVLSFSLPAGHMPNFFLKLFFAQGGLEIGDIRIKKI